MNSNFFTIGNSTVNFCEYDSYILGMGEPYNVLSSLIILFFGLAGLYDINCKYNNQNNILTKNILTKNILTNNKNKCSNILYVLLCCIGLGSMYFHYELSKFAHWVDIIFISIMLVYSQYILLSKKNQLVKKMNYIYIMLVHIITSLYTPYFHVFLLFGTGFAIKKSIDNKIELYNLIKIYPNNILQQKYSMIKKYFCLGIILWIIDFFGCWFISPYHVHWLFHILIGLVSYKIIGLVKYL